MDYVSNTTQEREYMLKEIGVEAVEEIFDSIPKEIKLERELDVAEGMSELELKRHMHEISEVNNSLENYTSFLGAGAYDHYIPGIIDHLISRQEFYTAYTPYQAELSQGTLQVIYEYQSMISELTGMGVANASLLDGGSAMGEAVLMASRISRNKKILISSAVHPSYKEVAKTYGEPQNLEFVEIGLDGSITDLTELESNLDDDTAVIVVQYPNFYGSIEEMKKIQELKEQYKRVLLLVVANPIALGTLTPPGAFDADIVVGEGQSLGNTLNYGGPYLGFLACKDDRKFIRQTPGRIAGATDDAEGNRGYVLTLQTREQHIRREKATSNMCTNEALNAAISTIYMSTMGRQGLKEVAEQSFTKAHYLAEKIDELDKFEVVNIDNYFHEFWLKTKLPVSKVLTELKENKILGGIDLSRFDEEEGILMSVTEKRTKDELDELVQLLGAM
ncbi:MAG TPA: aminomethyl-transferring glycine dehydrogenase subunit GcvPA [Halanaerobiales bacterium]|nr:aminomethyl-transferring glycine dehydrogenase subunit GcvPA [Halanaerobiales bacterium]